MNRQALARTFNKVVEKLGVEELNNIVLNEQNSRVIRNQEQATTDVVFHVKTDLFEKIIATQVNASLPTMVRGQRVIHFMGHRFIDTWPGDDKVTIFNLRGNISITKE